MKKFSLSEEEKNNVLGRKRFLGYVQDLIERDISMYMYTVIMPRLGIDQKDSVVLSEDSSFIEVMPKVNEKNGKK